jgi:cell division protein FtsQ
MINKRLLVLILSVVFAFTIVAVGFFALSSNKVELNLVTFEESADRVQRLKGDLDQFKDKNFLFVDTEEIKNIVESDPYLECISVKKKFPDKIIVEAKERREVYYLTYQDKNYLLNEKGFVLGQTEEEVNRNLIKLNLVGVGISSISVGAVIQTTSSVLSDLFSMTEFVNSTDCVKEMTVEDKVVQTDVVYDTYTNVKIRIVDAGNQGMPKAEKAFWVYDNEAKDYVKSFNELKVYLENGLPVAVWTRRS